MTKTGTSTSPAERALRKEFKAVGLKAAEVMGVLPAWWEDAIAHPSGVVELRGFVAKRFGLEISPEGKLRQRPLPQACFKTAKNTDITSIAPARAMTAAIAKIVASVTIPAWTGTFPRSAIELRASILETKDRPWVGLEGLLHACWSSGVPVIYLPELPVAGPKMDGLVTFGDGRPAIIITKKCSAPAWMLFILAHEMGHLALGHLEMTEGRTLVDESVSEDDGSPDDQEREANAYALSLLTGGNGRNFRLPKMGTRALAHSAKEAGTRNHIDPGHLILNAARNTPMPNGKQWPLANEALKSIDQNVPAREMTRAALKKNVNDEFLSDDNFEFLERLDIL